MLDANNLDILFLLKGGREVKYTLLETFFCDHWQWLRRRSKFLWVKSPGGSWVKFSPQEIEFYKGFGIDLINTHFPKEDWRQ